jgi:hypothetical protein
LREVAQPYWKKLIEEKDIKVEPSVWFDNTGHVVEWHKYETMENFCKFWNDERAQQNWARYAYLVDNMKIRLLRPSVTIPEE